MQTRHGLFGLYHIWFVVTPIKARQFLSGFYYGRFVGIPMQVRRRPPVAYPLYAFQAKYFPLLLPLESGAKRIGLGKEGGRGMASEA